MSLFDRAKFILTANAYKAGKLYSLKGHDIPFVRDSTATRRAVNGNISSVLANIPRLNHYGNISKILIEDQSINLTKNQTLLALGEGVIQHNYSTSPSGDQDSIYLKFGTSINHGARLPGLDSVAATPSTQYTLSYWAKSISGNGNIDTRIDTNTATAVSTKTVVATSQWTRFAHTFTTDVNATAFSNNSRFRNVSNNLGEVEIWGLQLELGSVDTSYIGSTQTRAADQPTSFNPVSLGYLLANEGSIVINDTVYRYTSDGNMETFIDGESQGTEAATPPTSWTLPVGETERILMFDYPLSNIEISAL